MTKQEIRAIVCAIWGKPTSRKTVTRAIELALEHQARLTFVHFVNADFLMMATPGMSSIHRVYNQLQEMGEFAMLLLVDRANRRGVDNADFIVRQGNIMEHLPRVLAELQPEMLVIGQPAPELESPVFTPVSFAEFIAKLEQENGILIEQVDPNN